MWTATKAPTWSHMSNRHVEDVTDIAEKVFPNPWKKENLISYINVGTVNGRVAYQDNEIVGFMTYELNSTYYGLSAIAIHPDHQRQGHATHLMNGLKATLRPEFRHRIVAYVEDNNLGTHLFLRQEQFLATKIDEEFFVDSDVNAYKFEFYL